METAMRKSELIARLRSEILSLQGFRTPSLGQHSDFGLGPVEAAFPNGVFPIGAIHEFISSATEESAATSGFMAALAGRLMKEDGICLWIGTRRSVFPLALHFFGAAPERVIFVDVKKERDLLWMIEEGLKCEALAAVIGEIKEISLTGSRRLQLAVEQSKVTGLLHRVNPRLNNPVASVCRWQISPIPSQLDTGLPGVGFARWNVQIVKVRNGEPGSWQLEWSNGRFTPITRPVIKRVGKRQILRAV
ncbi:ImuA family protein [Dyadobacter pollutisoli]|jgi:protein ImuA|uniref:Error-prone repair protein ImuA n=1 Tax=Dyadobacter pollutisoli TaxID=2910158 RepID=A0A9E8SPK1_9BACT|nr:Error-prone repair protein ImuA [Dyadobacter pollutisoli]WAC14821.1 Error-prone repair protein ImuA [Dyadobacter pollutisoli]